MNIKERIKICDYQKGKALLAGRVIGLIDVDQKAFVLQDDSGRIDIYASEMPKIGSLVLVEIEDGKLVKISELASCEEFFVNKSSPNYQKIIIDLSLREKILQRQKLYEAVRKFFKNESYIEVETPELVKLPGMEPYLDVFKTRFEANFALDKKVEEDMYLITSPEYAMKKLLVGGLEKIFQITKAFRNKEAFSSTHNPEFSILEWYRAYADYQQMMDETEALVKTVAKEFKIDKYDVEWERISVADAFQKYAGYSKSEFEKKMFNDDWFFDVFMNKIEPILGKERPQFVFDYPITQAALAKARDGKYAERFELYIDGLELCNGFSELNEACEQLKRLNEEKALREKLSKNVYSVDKSFVEALKFGMPPATGNALGLDRLLMIIGEASNIEQVLTFPYKDL
ncbi:EF-P lysine aminoacylase GenX [Candidatus Peregrinibacteria bacterium]|nr:EF-P lysine aminoacylase GenX [Candidatus Peregrinibacteria bacterium]